MKFSKGTTVDVFYNPSAPSQSALDIDRIPFSRLFVVVGSLSLLAGAIIWWLPLIFHAHVRLYAVAPLSPTPVFALVFPTQTWLRYRLVKRACPVPARITKSELRPSANSSRFVKLYQPFIEFDYTVDGISYTSRQSHAFSEESAMNEEKARQKLEQWHAMEPFTVYHLPKKPWDAFIKRGNHRDILFSISFPFIAIAMLLLLMLWR